MATQRELMIKRNALVASWATRLLNGETQKSIARSAGVSHQYVNTLIRNARLPPALRHTLDTIPSRRKPRQAKMHLGRVNARLNEEGQHWCSTGHHLVAVADLCLRNGKFASPCRACRVIAVSRIKSRRIAAGLCGLCGDSKPCRCSGDRAKFKHRARHALRRAVADGRVTRPSTCADCHRPGKVNGHHDDYSKPLDVRWLCYGCHALLHRDERIRARYNELSVRPEPFNADPADLIRAWESK